MTEQAEDTRPSEAPEHAYPSAAPASPEDAAALAERTRAALNPVDEDAEDVEAAAVSTAPVYVLVDGENIDATLGTSILGHRPSPGERPRWDRLMRFVQRTYGSEVKGLFFLAANGDRKSVV